MLLPYDIRPDREGWTVFDVTTSRPGFLHEVLLVGFSLEDAEEAANALNALEIALHPDARRVVLLDQN
jgi:hypothetical protein